MPLGTSLYLYGQWPYVHPLFRPKRHANYIYRSSCKFAAIYVFLCSFIMPVDKFGNNYFEIEFPAIKSASVYYFKTPSGLHYEVRFGRRQDNILHATIVFGVINEEFEGEEYVTTNRGEVYGVMS